MENGGELERELKGFANGHGAGPGTPGHRRRKRILVHLCQPMTTRQIARALHESTDPVREAIAQLADEKLVDCLNPLAQRSRLFWLTKPGVGVQHRVRQRLQLHDLVHQVPQIDWGLYGWLCFNHRQAVIKTLVCPMRPPQIRRRAVFQDKSLRMSAPNVRDVLQDLWDRKIVQKQKPESGPHPMYRLTSTGQVFRTLLLDAEQRWAVLPETTDVPGGNHPIPPPTVDGTGSP